MQDVHALVLGGNTARSLDSWRVVVLHPLEVHQGLEQAVVVEGKEPCRALAPTHVRVELLRLEDELESLQAGQIHHHVVPATPVVSPAGTVRRRFCLQASSAPSPSAFFQTEAD